MSSRNDVVVVVDAAKMYVKMEPTPTTHSLFLSYAVLSSCVDYYVNVTDGLINPL